MSAKAYQGMGIVIMRWFRIYPRNVDQGRWPVSDPDQALLE